MVEITSDEQALEIMRGCGEYYGKESDGLTPNTRDGYVGLDGMFTADQLRAILYFFEKDNGLTQS